MICSDIAVPFILFLSQQKTHNNYTFYKQIQSAKVPCHTIATTTKNYNNILFCYIVWPSEKDNGVASCAPDGKVIVY